MNQDKIDKNSIKLLSQIRKFSVKKLITYSNNRVWMYGLDKIIWNSKKWIPKRRLPTMRQSGFQLPLV